MIKSTFRSVTALFFIFLTIQLSGCGGGNSSSSSSDSSSYTLSGQAQKGPLIFGSRIWVSELDTKLNPNGKSYLIQTTDDLGNFAVSSAIGSNLVEILGVGYYMDELSGNLSTSTITLSAIADLSVDNTPTINILTTLQAPRVKNLILQGRTYSEALEQSQREVLAAFGIDSAKIDSLNSLYAMNIIGTSDQDSVLLATSAILSKMSSLAAASNGSSQAAEMSYYLSRIASEIANTGTLSTNSIISARNTAASQIDLSAVRSNVEAYYASRGVSVTAPKFEEWIDKDNSGVLPRRLVAATALVFNDATTVKPALPITSNAITVGGIGSGKFAPIVVSAGVKIIKNGSVISGLYSTVQDGDSIALQVSSPGFGATVTAAVSVGSSVADWAVTTRQPLFPIYWGGENLTVANQTASNRYFAVPFYADQSITVHYAGVQLGSTHPATFSIYSNNSGAPGIALASSSIFDNYFTGQLDGVAIFFPNIQAFFGSAGVPLQSGNAYWLVADFGGIVNPGYLVQAGGVNATGLARKMSLDGTNWVNWVGTSGSAEDMNPLILPGGFISD